MGCLLVPAREFMNTVGRIVFLSILIDVLVHFDLKLAEQIISFSNTSEISIYLGFGVGD
jgi:hypothetical protein